ncbi:ABC transporter permease [Saliterribacillus persicus]|uniref:Peptide/nickel transport system permease protein n=1 Tax=Saliterribacillus persicus TaxID=930114 RepID=A0A368YBE0_9BACI|nr:ABC transporter permease [Saliterribacillus persicus]RCW77019.1 peptide/nickel transport system permease protein [Saliterribacillus persicus]
MLLIFSRKILEALLTLGLATSILFILIRLAPGDPVAIMIGQSSDVASSNTERYEQKLLELRSEFGLNQTIFQQYFIWMKQLILFDLGDSIHTGRSVMTEIADRLPATILLSVAALFIQIVLGILLGVLSALKFGRFFDHLTRFLCVLFASTPGFVIGLVLLSTFAVTFSTYEINTEAKLSRLWLPALTLGMIGAPQWIRTIRANMLTEFGQPYISSAVSRGLKYRRIVEHAFKNTLLPIVTMTGLSLTTLISGAVVIESIFSWPGIGKYALDSILLKDYPVIQGYALLMIALVIVIHLVIEIVYSFIDPRIHRKGEENVKKDY